MFLAVAFAEASLRLRKVGAWVLVIAVLYLAAENLLVTNQYFYQLARYGPARSWTDAIYELSRNVGELKPSKVVIDDWGILNQLVLLHRGQLPLEFAGDRFLSPSLPEEEKNWDRGRLEHGLWLGHTAACEEFRGANDRILKAARAPGFRKKLIKTHS